MTFRKKRQHLYRAIFGIALAASFATGAAACSIPTEDQPQPINRDAPITAVPEIP